MNFLWDIVVRAKEQGMLEEDMLFGQAKEYSPFFEQAFPCLNETQVESNEIEVNLLLRFAPIFQYILSEDMDEYPKLRTYLVDVALHMIIYADLRHGLTKRDIYVRKLLEELWDGVFWMDGAKEFRLIPLAIRNRLATLVFSQIQTGSSLMLFRKALVVVHPDVVLYQFREEPKKLILYLKERKTEVAERILQLLQDIFLPFGYHVQIFWEYHFGILGVEGTMKMGEIALY